MSGLGRVGPGPRAREKGKREGEQENEPRMQDDWAADLVHATRRKKRGNRTSLTRDPGWRLQLGRPS